MASDPVPYDIGALAAARDRAGLRWPVSVEEVKALDRALLAGLAEIARGEDDADVRDILAIAAPAILITLLTEMTVALTAERARQREMTFHHTMPSLAADLASGELSSSGRIYDRAMGRFEAATRDGWRPWARDLAHGLLTNRGPRLGRPCAMVLNHNTLLQRAARLRRDRRFIYRSPSRLFGSGSDTLAETVRRRLAELAEALVGLGRQALGNEAALLPAHAERLSALTASWLATVASHRSRLDRSIRSAPAELWTGTGGNYVSRQVRAAMRRRGSAVIGFEHGGGGHIHRSLGAETINEFWLADRFVADTPAKADVYRRSLAASPLVFGAAPAIDGAPQGAASFHWGAAGRPQSVRRVMYVTTAFVGETCYPIQPLMPDPIYADWQGRLIDGLSAQGFEVLIKQHPQGLTAGKPLVMSSHGAYLTGRFHEVIDRADAFVFDYPATTSLWEAVCTAKPVLFVDLGLADWEPEVRALFERRCAVVRGGFDDDNRPQVDFASLREALASAPDDDTFATAYLTGCPRS
jgi:hypothetical protein